MPRKRRGGGGKKRPQPTLGPILLAHEAEAKVVDAAKRAGATITEEEPKEEQPPPPPSTPTAMGPTGTPDISPSVQAGGKSDASVGVTPLVDSPVGGKLRRGGPKPVASGWSGAALRRAMRQPLADRVLMLLQIMDSEDASHRDRMQAFDLLAKYGLGLKQPKVDAELLQALALAVQAEVEDAGVLKRVEERWRVILRELHRVD